MARVLVALWLLTPLAGAETLREELTRNSISVAGLPASDLDRAITSYAALNEPRAFYIAYYVRQSDAALPRELNVWLLDKSNGRWIRRVLEYRRLIPDAPDFYTGSVTDIGSSPNFLFLKTHRTPSAGYTLVLTRSLEFRDALYGWPLALFADDTLVFHNSQIHFAPTHSAEISVYDPHTRRQQKIYPMKPYQAIRLKHIEAVRRTYERRGVDWFRNNNHHMDPELFDSCVKDKVVVNDQTRSLAFLISFDNKDTDSPGVTDVLYIYRRTNGGFEYRELLWQEGNLSNYLQPHNLKRIFQ